MFVGHYGVGFAVKRADPAIPLWVLFLAVQWLDVLWAPLVLLGIEKVRIVPGITGSNPFDLYYMPYTHSLPAPMCASARRRLSTLRRPSLANHDAGGYDRPARGSLPGLALDLSRAPQPPREAPCGV